MKLLRSIYYFFSPYVNSHERSVGLFFAKLNEHSPVPSARARVGELLQQDIAALNLWSEHRYKGYTYLRKSHRKLLYENLALIASDFDTFYQQQKVPAEKVVSHIHLIAPHAHVEKERAVLLQALTDYFSPERGVYVYRASSSFGRLLQDPTKEKLVGDCNQIVTLYLYLYSRYFPLVDLKLRVLPQHVALHYGGVDIEATSGGWANYESKEGARLMPVEEIVSINLLDTTDENFAKFEVSATDFLQAARFAYMLSHDRDIVNHNLEAAYSKLITALMQKDNYVEALKIAKESRDVTFRAIVGHNGAVYHMKRHEFQSARKYAEYATERAALMRQTYHAEGVYHYKAHRYQQAITAFKKYGDQSLVNACYEGLFFEEQKKLPSSLTTASIQSHARTIRQMEDYAKRSGNRELIAHAAKLRSHLS